MKPSANTYNLAKESEGLRLTAYPDPASGGEPYTIGYGITRGVKKGMTITLAEAQQRLVVDMTEAGNAVTRWWTCRLRKVSSTPWPTSCSIWRQQEINEGAKAQAESLKQAETKLLDMLPQWKDAPKRTTRSSRMSRAMRRKESTRHSPFR